MLTAAVGDHRYQEEERCGGAALFIHATTSLVAVVSGNLVCKNTIDLGLRLVDISEQL